MLKEPIGKLIEFCICILLYITNSVLPPPISTNKPLFKSIVLAAPTKSYSASWAPLNKLIANPVLSSISLTAAWLLEIFLKDAVAKTCKLFTPKSLANKLKLSKI